jgi:hypothetical protein
MLYRLQQLQSLMTRKGVVALGENERIWEEAVLAYLKKVSRHLLGETE